MTFSHSKGQSILLRIGRWNVLFQRSSEFQKKVVDVELGDVRRERVGLPLLRDERPELHLRELRRILAERTGLDLDEASEPLDGPPAALRADGPKGGPTSGPKGGPTRGKRTRR